MVAEAHFLLFSWDWEYFTQLLDVQEEILANTSYLQWLLYAGPLSIYVWSLPSTSLHFGGFFSLFFCTSSNAWHWELTGQGLLLLQQARWETGWTGHPSRCPPWNPSLQKCPPLTHFPRPQWVGSIYFYLSINLLNTSGICLDEWSLHFDWISMFSVLLSPFAVLLWVVGIPLAFSVNTVQP